jgi:hypothetical protein
MQGPNLDPVAVLVVLATLLVSPQVAAVAGPYLVILIGSSMGAFLMLGRRQKPPSERGWYAFALFLVINGCAFLFTVAAAVIAQKFVPIIPDSALLYGPIAFVIGLIGDRWPQLIPWAGRKINALVDVLIRWRIGRGEKNDVI